MAIMITSECINCGACEPECPNTAIYEGGNNWTLGGDSFGPEDPSPNGNVGFAQSDLQSEDDAQRDGISDPPSPDLLHRRRLELFPSLCRRG